MRQLFAFNYLGNNFSFKQILKRGWASFVNLLSNIGKNFRKNHPKAALAVKAKVLRQPMSREELLSHAYYELKQPNSPSQYIRFEGYWYASFKKFEFPLVIASERGNLELVKLLVQGGAFVNTTHGDKFETPLMMAAVKGHAAIVAFLLTKGALLSITNSFGETALHCAAANPEGLEALKALLVVPGINAHINAKDDKGLTPLHLAVKNRNVPAIEALLAAGANLEIADNEGCTPLLTAVESDLQILILLLKKGANVNAVDNRGNTPLHLAIAADDHHCWYGNGHLHQSEMVRALLSMRPEIMVNAVNADNETALHLVAKYTAVEAFNYLLTLRPTLNINIEDKDGNTPLMLAYETRDGARIKSLPNEIINRLERMGARLPAPGGAAPARDPREQVLHEQQVLVLQFDAQRERAEEQAGNENNNNNNAVVQNNKKHTHNTRSKK